MTSPTVGPALSEKTSLLIGYCLHLRNESISTNLLFLVALLNR